MKTLKMIIFWAIIIIAAYFITDFIIYYLNTSEFKYFNSEWFQNIINKIKEIKFI